LEERKIERHTILPSRLPSAKDIISEGREIGKEIEIGTTLFMEVHGVRSEAEYKLRMKKERKMMYHAHIGLNSWEGTKKALKYIYAEVTKRGEKIDRFGLCLDRTMGLPPELRDKAPKETGPLLRTKEEWLEIGRIVPIQPHMGDFMIGSPNSVANTRLALEAGTTTIGNVTQYLTFEYPYWKDVEKTTIETVKALGIMAKLKDKGALVHSYLDDGWGAQFSDYTSFLGWAIIEKYIVEKLIGAKLGHCFGGVISDMQIRMAMNLALDAAYQGESIGTMVYGDTVDYSVDLDRNLATLTSCTLFDIISQLKNPTGHAIMPVPLSEGIRIPSPEEIVKVHSISREVERKVRANNLAELVNWEKIKSLSEEIMKGARVFYGSVLKGLDEIGVDTKDPIELLLASRNMGATKLEEEFGAGSEDEVFPYKRRPVFPTWKTKLLLEAEGSVKKSEMQMQETKYTLRRLKSKLVLATTDVHEMAKEIVKLALKRFCVEVIDIGTSKDPEEVVEAAITSQANAIAISTYNGLALEYAKKLVGEMERRHLKVPVYMGGNLTQDKGEDLPVDVTEDLRALHIITCRNPRDLLDSLAHARTACKSRSNPAHALL